MTEKKCSKCGEWKLFEEFHKDKSTKDGRTYACKACAKLHYCTNKELIDEQQRKYKQANKELRSEYSRKWYEANRDSKLEYLKKDQKANPEKFRARNAKRRAVKKSTSTTDPWELQQIAIFYANCPEGYHIDHIIPLSKGGTHTLSNLQYLEVRLNLSKSDIHPNEWDDPRPISCAA